MFFTRVAYTTIFTLFVCATADSRGSQCRAVNVAVVTRTERRDIFEGGDLKCIIDRCRAVPSLSSLLLLAPRLPLPDSVVTTRCKYSRAHRLSMDDDTKVMEAEIRKVWIARIEYLGNITL